MCSQARRSLPSHPSLFHLGTRGKISGLLAFWLLCQTGLHAQTPALDSFNPRLDGEEVLSVALRPDGRMLLGRDSILLNEHPYGYLNQLDANGAPDLTYMGSNYLNYNATIGYRVSALALFPNGNVLSGSTFRLQRTRPDSTPDVTYASWQNVQHNTYAIVRKPDDSVLVASDSSLLHYLADGTIDNTFNVQADGAITSVALQADGKLIVGGSFQNIAGAPRQNLARLLDNGTIEAAFVADANYPVNAVAVQGDQRILVGGAFDRIGGRSMTRLARLETTGAVDTSFVAPVNSTVNSIILQADGRIILGGSFSQVSGQARVYIARLLPSGALDSSFAPIATVNADGRQHVKGLALQEDGRLLVLGTFTQIDNITRTYVARFLNTDPATSSLQVDANGATWLRGGTCPDLSRVTFQIYTNGLDASPRMLATRVASGWSLPGLVLPPQSIILAEGYAVGGRYNGSSWPVQLVSQGPAAILGNPIGGQYPQGAVIRMSVTAQGPGPFTYQWLHDGQNVSNDVSISGAQSDSLTINNASTAANGEYWVKVSNAFGTTTSRHATLSVLDPFIVSQPVSTNILETQTATLSLTAGGSGPFHVQWRRNGIPIPGATNAVAIANTNLILCELALTHATPAQNGSYDVIVSNGQGSVTSAAAMVQVRSLVRPLNTFIVGPENYITTVAVRTVLRQPDGLLLVGGEFLGIGTTETNIATPRLVRLYPNGELDPAFHAEIPVDTMVMTIALNRDGSMWVGLVGETKGYLIRLRADGSAMPGTTVEFTEGKANNAFPLFGPLAFLQLPNGQLVVGGNFGRVGGATKHHLTKFLADGTWDASFSPEPNGPVCSLLWQNDGQILAGGYYSQISGQNQDNLARISPAGVVDQSFAPNPNYPVYAMVQSLDSNLWHVGAFDRFAKVYQSRMAKSSLAGTFDTNFTASASAEPIALAQLVNGDVLVSGRFQGLSGAPNRWIAEMTSAGGFRQDFNPTILDADDLSPWWGGGAASWLPQITSMAVQPDGTIIVGGLFHSMGNFPNRHLSRLLPAPGPAPTESLVWANTKATWLRSGPVPEFLWTTFEVSVDGLSWSDPLPGYRISGGWEATGFSTAGALYVRARGFLSGGGRSSSCWFMETRTGPPVFLRQPVNRTAQLGNTVYFHAAAAGSAGFTYQWFRNGQPLEDNARYTGTHSATLTITGAAGTDAGLYTVRVSNSIGSSLSDPAQLLVGDPLITLAPVDAVVYEGQAAQFSVTASGSGTLAYQWRHNGTNLPGANASTLSWSRAALSAAGTYDVVVTGQFGSLTSSQAKLTVLTRSLPDLLNPAPDAYISAVVEQLDGRLLVGGGFNHIAGQPQPGLVRLLDDGTLDPTFQPAPNDAVLNICQLPNGQIIAAGQFTRIGGQAQAFLARLNADGTLDSSFHPNLDWIVTTVLLQPDGRLVIGGEFTAVNQIRRNYLARLNTDGSLDESFTTETDNYVETLAWQSDGRILVGGGFQQIHGESRPWLARLLANGSPDRSFASPNSGPVYALAVLPDGRIVAGGESWNNTALNRYAPDGARDVSFGYDAETGAGATVFALALQTDGSLLVGGEFSRVGRLPFENLARLTASGTPDTEFRVETRGAVYTMGLQSDGRILVGGSFLALGGQTRANLGRLSNRNPAVAALTREGATISWTRLASSPEITRATAEVAIPAGGWSLLGDGTRTATGWTWSDLALPPNSVVRVRGYVSAGSSWLVEGKLLAPGATEPPRFTSAGTFLPPDNAFMLGLTSSPGAVLELQSTDALDSPWVTQQTFTNRTGQMWITDPTPAFGARMYRLLQTR